MASGPIKAASQASGSEKDGASSVGDGQSSMGASSEVWGLWAACAAVVGVVCVEFSQQPAVLHITAIAAELQPAHLLSTHPLQGGEASGDFQRAKRFKWVLGWGFKVCCCRSGLLCSMHLVSWGSAHLPKASRRSGSSAFPVQEAEPHAQLTPGPRDHQRAAQVRRSGARIWCTANMLPIAECGHCAHPRRLSCLNVPARPPQAQVVRRHDPGHHRAAHRPVLRDLQADPELHIVRQTGL